MFFLYFIYSENDQYLMRGSLSNVNSLGDCDGATQSERRRSLPVTAFHVISAVNARLKARVH